MEEQSIVEKLGKIKFPYGMVLTSDSRYQEKLEESLSRLIFICNSACIDYKEIKNYAEKCIDNSNQLYRLVSSGKSIEQIKELLN
jgi:NTP pyrophosphatase (non-canonical NTP hydrolase)